jgi:hypothetical protein
MQVLSTMSAGSRYAVEADQTVFICRCIFIPYLVEDSTLVKLGQVAGEVELWKVLNISRIFGSPSVGGIHCSLTSCFAVRSVSCLYSDFTANNARCPCLRLGILQHGCLPPAVALSTFGQSSIYIRRT